MASLNDILFTIFPPGPLLRKRSGTLRTALGPLRLCFSNRGLERLWFEAASSSADEDTDLRQVFSEWLAGFLNAEPDQQWSCLAPDGTPFQKSVWRALLDIPPGETASYREIASRVGRPAAFRAVGSAIGANPVAILIPCHRVLPIRGGVGNYRWGTDRKQALLDLEQVRDAESTSFLQ